jgi:hypothetical protein
VELTTIGQSVGFWFDIGMSWLRYFSANEYSGDIDAVDFQSSINGALLLMVYGTIENEGAPSLAYSLNTSFLCLL